MSDYYAEDTLRRCRWALQHNDGHPAGVWSTGEKLAVALVLQDWPYLEAMDYTIAEAAHRVAGGIGLSDDKFADWLTAVQLQLGRERFGGR